MKLSWEKQDILKFAELVIRPRVEQAYELLISMCIYLDYNGLVRIARLILAISTVFYRERQNNTSMKVSKVKS